MQACDSPCVGTNITQSGVPHLIGQQHTRNGTAIPELTLRVNIILPLQSVHEGVAVCQVEHNDTAIGIFVVHSGHPGKSFLTC